ncbi:hypothetical protein MML48_7g00011720 [Holotrichia oblita]|uniref:Uncharacterized protein n=1 Tax=Holotrichia oblita TaxID=644536 RepID=A0ACB9SSU7_HOLOL|nr:hypothetical protein MML48_7g00011720 [Holotrichia oblita]
MLPPSNGKMSDFSEIVKQTQALPKLPKHITILLGNEEPSYRDLTNIVLWSIAAGIPFISFYDHKGLLRKSETLLKAQVEDEKNVGDHIIWHNSKGAYKNGYIGRRIHVKILSPVDGKAQFAEVCKTLAQQDITIEKINIQSLDSYLRDHYEFPDPDLGIYCGKNI